MYLPIGRIYLRSVLFISTEFPSILITSSVFLLSLLIVENFITTDGRRVLSLFLGEEDGDFEDLFVHN